MTHIHTLPKGRFSLSLPCFLNRCYLVSGRAFPVSYDELQALSHNPERVSCLHLILVSPEVRERKGLDAARERERRLNLLQKDVPARP